MRVKHRSAVIACVALTVALSLLGGCANVPFGGSGGAQTLAALPILVSVPPVMLYVDGFENNTLSYHVECDYTGSDGRPLPLVTRANAVVTWQQGGATGPSRSESRAIPFPTTCSTFRNVTSNAFTFPAQSFTAESVTVLIGVEWYGRDTAPPEPPPALLPTRPVLVGSVTATTARTLTTPSATAPSRPPTASGTVKLTLGNDRKVYIG